MAKPKDECECESSDDRGCLFILGLVIVGICVGNIYTAAAGWLVIGCGLLLIAILPTRRSQP